MVKIEAMLFGTHARLSDADFGITFKGQLIKRVFEFRYLGVAFDKHTPKYKGLTKRSKIIQLIQFLA